MYVYVAGPYGSMPESNTHRAIRMGNKLMDAGFIPFVPHVNAHYWHSLYNMKEKEWMAYDLAWLRKCDVVMRMEGESKGADEEVEEAKRLGIPVVYSVDELVKVEKEKENR